MKRTRVLARRCAAHRQSDHFLRQLDDDERIAVIVKATLLFNILKSERGQKPLRAGRVGFVTLESRNFAQSVHTFSYASVNDS